MTAGTRRAGLGLALLAAFHMREALLEGRVYFERDLHLQWYGQVQSFVAALAAGAWPLWDPWVGFGQPLLANANAQLLYPPTWLNLLMQPGRYYTAYLFGHLLAAGIGAYLLSRRWEVSRAGSFVAAAFWISSGPLLSLGNAWNHLAGAALLPFLLLAAERLADERRRPVLALAALAALGVLAGSPDFLLLALLPMLAVLLAPSARPRVPVARRLGRLAAAGVLGAGLCAAQLLPSLELVMSSSRAHLPSTVRGYWSVHPWVALQSLVPLEWNALAWLPERRALWFESREPYLFSLYVGVPVVALALLGLRREGHVRRTLLASTALVALLFALGRHTPAYEALAFLLPPLRLIRFPAKAMVLVAFAAAMLAGAGFDRWRAARERGVAWGSWVLGGGLALLAGAFLVHPAALAAGLVTALPGTSPADALQPLVAALLRAAALAATLGVLGIVRGKRPALAPATAAAVAALGILDLALLQRDRNPTAPADFYRVRPEVLRALPPGDRGRLLTFDYTMAPGLSEGLLGRARPYMVGAEPGARNLWRGAMGLRLYPVAPVNGGFFVYGSYGRDFLGIQPEPVTRLNDFVNERMGMPEWPRLLALASVSRLVTLHDAELGSGAPRRFHGPFFEDERLYDVPGALPRCQVVGGIRAGDAPETLLAPDFDPRREVLLTALAARPAPAGFTGRCEVRALDADRAVLETDANAPGVAVLMDAWDPEWRVDVDGREAPLLRGNVAFRAVALEAGRHEVRMRYRPRSVVVGLWASAASLVLAAALGLRAGRTPRA